MKIYVTKYALTKGIQEFDAAPSKINPGMAVVHPLGRGAGVPQYFHKGQWHLTREAAVERAEVMRARKLASLRRQTIDLEALKFQE